MKILYLVHQFYPMHYTGTEKFILHMATMMQKLGSRVKVVTYSFYEDSFYDRSAGNVMLRDFSYKGIPVLAFKYRREPPDLSYGLENEDLSRSAKRLVAAEVPDVVHVGHPMRVHELVRHVKAYGIPYKITLTDFWLMCPRGILSTSGNALCSGPEGGAACAKSCPEFSETFISRRLGVAREMLSGARHIVSPSRFVASVFEKEFPELSVRIINHGMSYSKIRRNGRRYAQGDALTFFYGGSLLPHKGVHVLIDAFTTVHSPRAGLKIFGSGDPAYVNDLRDRARGDDRIEFCGVFSEEQIGEILCEIDVVVVPSLWYENYPLVLHEALACNVPVIASNVGGMAEKIQDGENGFLFRIGDAGHLKEVFERVIADPSKMNELKKNIKAVMIPTVEQEALAYERGYQRAASRVFAANAVRESA